MADLTLFPSRADSGRRPLILGTLGHAVNDAYTAFLPAMLPIFHLQLGLSEATLAGLVAIFALSASLPGPLLGRLSDRFGEATVTAASVLFSTVLLSLLAVAPTVPLLFGLVAVAGFGSAAIHPAGSMHHRGPCLTDNSFGCDERRCRLPAPLQVRPLRFLHVADRGRRGRAS